MDSAARSPPPPHTIPVSRPTFSRGNVCALSIRTSGRENSVASHGNWCHSLAGRAASPHWFAAFGPRMSGGVRDSARCRTTPPPMRGAKRGLGRTSLKSNSEAEDRPAVRRARGSARTLSALASGPWRGAYICLSVFSMKFFVQPLHPARAPGMASGRCVGAVRRRRRCAPARHAVGRRTGELLRAREHRQACERASCWTSLRPLSSCHG